MENEQKPDLANQTIQPRWNHSCPQCGNTNPESHPYAVCKDCLQKGKDSGFYDQNW